MQRVSCTCFCRGVIQTMGCMMSGAAALWDKRAYKQPLTIELKHDQTRWCMQALPRSDVAREDCLTRCQRHRNLGQPIHTRAATMP